MNELTVHCATTVPTGRPVVDAKTRQRTRLVLAAVVGLAAVSAWAAIRAGAVSALATSLATWLSEATSALSWSVIVALVVVCVLHYVAAAVAARAAAGVRMPFGELFATQFAAAAANRLTPAGLGGAGVLGRHLTRRGSMRAAEAAAAVSSLAVVGAVADVAAFAALIGVGVVSGVSGASSEVPLLLQRLAGLLPVSGTDWWWVAGASAVVVPAMICVARSRSGGITARLRAAGAAYLDSARVLLRRPGRVGAVMATSASTTLLLAVGFAAAATFGSQGLPAAAFGALMIGYMVAAAAGNALPTPGGIGTVDAALVGVLLASGVPTTSAVGIVLAFRLITFWCPAVVGLGLIAPLRRRGAI